MFVFIHKTMHLYKVSYLLDYKSKDVTSSIFCLGCWIESALMRFLLFGVPIAIILIINFIFYTLTVRSIRHRFKSSIDYFIIFLLLNSSIIFF